MRFSIIPRMDHSWDETLELVRHCDAAGWDGVYFPDHFMPLTQPDRAPADGPYLECWSVLAALAASTTQLRVGSLVSCVSYRHPAVLANIASVIDQVSHGRCVMGVGAGWRVNEHRAYGIPLLAVKERIDRFEEAVRVLLGLLREQRTTFSGEYFEVTDAPNDPKPVQDRLPLLIGCTGEQRMMRIAARYADEWNDWSTPDVMVRKRKVLESHCQELGRDPTEISISTQALLYMSADEDELASRKHMTDEVWLASRKSPLYRPSMIGTPSQITEIVAAYQEAGVDELIVPVWTMGPLTARKDTCDLFITEVAPHFR